MDDGALIRIKYTLDKTFFSPLAAQNPFYMKETRYVTHLCVCVSSYVCNNFLFLLIREVFRELFGAPNDKRTYLKVSPY